MKGAIITGGAQRIGGEISRYLAKKSYHIIITFNNSKTEAEKLRADIIKDGGQCSIFQCDLNDESQLEILISNISIVCKEVEILINNASNFDCNDILTTSILDLKKAFSINFFAPYILSRDFALKFGKGLIINIIDSKITKNGGKYSSYTLSKKALADLTLQTAETLAPDIRVNGISPGIVLAPELNNLDFDELAIKNPLGYYCSVSDIINSIDFIINSPFMTGQILYVDGGRHIRLGE